MKLTQIIASVTVDHLARAVEGTFVNTRFNVSSVTFTEEGPRRPFPSITINRVRLANAKPYCGNHPGACVRPHSGPKRKGAFLEGLDWVEFNDRLNDLLDDYNVSAIVYSKGADTGPGSPPLYIRLGPYRRYQYTMTERKVSPFDHYWDSMGVILFDYVCRIQRDGGLEHTVSTYPQGTPGMYDPARLALAE